MSSASAAPPQTSIPAPPRRWWRWKKAHRLKCADGHPYPNKFRIPERGPVRCEHWIATERRECGRWTYFIAQRGGGVFAADITLDELKELDRLETPTEVFDYLEIFPE